MPTRPWRSRICRCITARPFDGLLVAQARSEQLTIVTADRRIAGYDVPVVHAG